MFRNIFTTKNVIMYLANPNNPNNPNNIKILLIFLSSYFIYTLNKRYFHPTLK
jgi:hypothetical protein